LAGKLVHSKDKALRPNSQDGKSTSLLPGIDDLVNMKTGEKAHRFYGFGL